MFTLYAATSNPGKLLDFQHAGRSAHLLSSSPLAIQSLPGLASIPPPEEDQSTFAGNAVLKALFYSRHAPGLTVLADDSGLEVDALEGAPGVRSARFADDRQFSSSSSLPVDARNNLCLLAALAHTPPGARQARYRCVLAAARDGLLLATSEGSVAGEILSSERGSLGFGYDPLFYLPDFGCTMAELDPSRRLAVSHRGKALTALLLQSAFDISAPDHKIAQSRR